MTYFSTTHFGIIRHAPTQWNEKKRIQGQNDSPLSDRGKSMARAWGLQLDKFKWDILLCSDLGRVQQTAELINQTLALPLELDIRLREQNWGEWTGMTLKEVKALDKISVRAEEQKGWDFRPPGGESRREVLDRCMQVMIKAPAIWQGKNILVVCHEGVIKCLVYHLLTRKFLPEEPRVINNFNLHLLKQEDCELTLEALNNLALTTIPVNKTS